MSIRASRSGVVKLLEVVATFMPSGCNQEYCWRDSIQELHPSGRPCHRPGENNQTPHPPHVLTRGLDPVQLDSKPYGRPPPYIRSLPGFTCGSCFQICQGNDDVWVVGVCAHCVLWCVDNCVVLIPYRTVWDSRAVDRAFWIWVEKTGARREKHLVLPSHVGDIGQTCCTPESCWG